MKPSLQLAHAKALSSLEGVSPFELITTAHALSKETDEMQRTLRQKIAKTIKALRAQGATLEEISERTGIDDSTLSRLSRPRDSQG